MATPKESLNAVARAIANSRELPDEMSVLTQEADESADDADVDMPLLELQISEVDFVLTNNSDRTGFIVDDDGNKVGRIFDSEYEMSLQIDLWTTQKDPYDPDELGARLRDALYPYTSLGPDKMFRDASGEPLDRLYRFELGTGERADELIRTPSVRRWSQEVELWACETFMTEAEYIENVDGPKYGEFEDTDGDGTIVAEQQ